MALLSSNIIIGQSYIMDYKKFESKVSNQKEIIKQSGDEIYILEKLHKSETDDIKILRDQNAKVNSELSNVKKENETLKKENKTIKKDLATLQQRLSNMKYFEVTAYTSGYESTQKHEGNVGYGLTASGTYVKEGRTIACPPSLKFGTKLNIEGIGLRVCEDRGQAITKDKLDLYISNLSEAIKFGRRTLLVEVMQ